MGKGTTNYRQSKIFEEHSCGTPQNISLKGSKRNLQFKMVIAFCLAQYLQVSTQ